MPVWGIIVTEDVHRAHNVHALSVKGYQDLRLLLIGISVRIRTNHGDHDFATRITCTRDVELLAVNDPLVTVKNCFGFDLLRI